MIMENCPTTIPTVHTYYYSSNYGGVQIKECYFSVHVCLYFILYLTFVTGSGKYIYLVQVFWGVKISHIQRIGCQPEKTTLHDGQSRSWSAEQGEKKKVWQCTLPTPAPSPALLVRRRIYMLRRCAGLSPSCVRTRIPSTRRLGQWVSLRKILRFHVR